MSLDCGVLGDSFISWGKDTGWTCKVHTERARTSANQHTTPTVYRIHINFYQPQYSLILASMHISDTCYMHAYTSSHFKLYACGSLHITKPEKGTKMNKLDKSDWSFISFLINRETSALLINCAVSLQTGTAEHTLFYFFSSTVHDAHMASIIYTT